MSDILLSPEVSIVLLLDSLLFFILTLAFLRSIKLLQNYKKGATSQKQYQLERSSYLIITIISVSMISKILLLGFYIHTLDSISSIIPGAMCAAGVISSNIFGNYALILKIFIPLLSLLWLTLNSKDEKTKNQPYFKIKLYFFISIYLLILGEFILEIQFFSNISTLSPVLCCSSIYAQEDSLSPLPFGIDTTTLISLFYLLYLFIIISNHYKNKIAILLGSTLFLYVSYYAIVYFFGIYIYQLPTHKCPYCMLSKDYYYIGYFIYISLFCATFYSASNVIYDFEKNGYKLSSIFYTLFVFFTSLPFFLYLIKNHTFIIL
jgi:hypothetical protein